MQHANSESKLLSKEFEEIEIPVEQIQEGDLMIIKTRRKNSYRWYS